jgi:lactoylglutathione lyase
MNMHIEKIFAVWVYVSDIDTSRYFYEKILKVKFKYRDLNWIEYDLGDTDFAILQRPTNKGKVKPQKTRVMFQVDDIFAWKAAFIKHDVKIIGDIRIEAYGNLLTFADPDGHWLELFQPKKCLEEIKTRVW